MPRSAHLATLGIGSRGITCLHPSEVRSRTSIASHIRRWLDKGPGHLLGGIAVHGPPRAFVRAFERCASALLPLQAASNNRHKLSARSFRPLRFDAGATLFPNFSKIDEFVVFYRPISPTF